MRTFYNKYRPDLDLAPFPAPWARPLDWIDISNVANNEINLLVTKSAGLSFSITVADYGTFSVDWGDGIIENNLASGQTCFHTHSINGTPTSDGFDIWKVRIFNATGTITRYVAVRISTYFNYQSQGILWVVFGTVGITSYADAFYLNQYINNPMLRAVTIPSFENCTSVQGLFGNLTGLESVTLPSSWGSLTNVQQLFYYCKALKSVTLPSSWGNISVVGAMFVNCTSLTRITLPSSWGGITSLQQMFMTCSLLHDIVLPASWESISNISSCFNGCISLASVTLPLSFGNITNATDAFKGCQCLQTAIGIDYVGSLTQQCDFSTFLADCEAFSQNISMGSLISKISFSSTGGKNHFTSIRLTNQGSLFAGASSQISVFCSSLNAAALEVLFGDLPQGLSAGKSIQVSSSLGAPVMITKSNSTIAIGSATVLISNTSSLVVGMEVFGTGISSARTITTDYTTNLFTYNAHGLSNGTKVSFATSTQSGLSINTPYYIINADLNTFQVSLTLNGSAVDLLVANGSVTMITIPVIMSINDNVSIVIDKPAFANSSTCSVSACTLKKSIAMLKGWAIS